LKYFRGTSRIEKMKTERMLLLFPTRYLCCPDNMPTQVLKKFIVLKFELDPEMWVLDLWREDETIKDGLTLRQLVQIFGCYRDKKPLELHFSLLPAFESKKVEKKAPAIKRRVMTAEEKARMMGIETNDETSLSEAKVEESKDEAQIKPPPIKRRCMTEEERARMMGTDNETSADGSKADENSDEKDETLKPTPMKKRCMTEEERKRMMASLQDNSSDETTLAQSRNDSSKVTIETQMNGSVALQESQTDINETSHRKSDPLHNCEVQKDSKSIPSSKLCNDNELDFMELNESVSLKEIENILSSIVADAVVMSRNT